VLYFRDEAATITGIRDPVEAGRKIIEVGPKIAVIKMEEKGAVAVTRKETLFEDHLRSHKLI